MWTFEATMPLLNRDTAEIFNAWLLSLKGRKGTFLMPIPGAESPRGSVPGTPLVDGASQTGDSLDLKGFTASQTGVLKAGDYINLGTGANTHLHKVLADIDSDTAGNATVEIFPDLRESPTDSQSVITSDCKGLFRLADNFNGFDINSDDFYLLTFRGLEALDGS